MKVGILGPGGIARVMAETLQKMDGVSCVGVGSRTLERAQSFAKEFDIPKAYGSYEELVADSDVDLVYIATPHSEHFAHMKLALHHGKPVLCEKAFTLNGAEAREVLALGKEKNCLVAEAIWTRYMPLAEQLKQVVAEEPVGKPRSLSASLHYGIDWVPRIQDNALGGGALLDVGVYAVHFAALVFGSKVDQVSSTLLMDQAQGVDVHDSITFTYGDGRVASLQASSRDISSREGIINCEKGFLRVPNINNFERIEVVDANYQVIKTYQRPAQITGFEYQLAAVKDAIAQGKLECDLVTHQDILGTMDLMDRVRKPHGYTYNGK